MGVTATHVGTTDKPITTMNEDLLGVEKHIKGLSKFITVCETPMTIAIQGDWGTGKTSFMNLIKASLGKEVTPIWFNTWQFSQFNMEQSLSTVFLQTLIHDLTKGHSNDKVTELVKMTKSLGSMVLSGANLVVKNQTSIDVAELSATAFGDTTDTVSALKEKFQSTVNSILKKNQRLVVFVDDLDRLNPERAIEVLEVLKLFLDCDKCVFVLAIDYDVVCRGVGKKYGDDFKKDKGRSFFDKIIQVPFKMPTAHYEIEKYIKSNLEGMAIEATDIEAYSNLIAYSIGYNPRAMKRIFNAFLLLTMIYKEKELSDDYEQKTLFAVLCLQLSFEDAYNYIVADDDDNINRELIESIASGDDSDNENSLAADFYSALEDKIQTDGTLDEGDMERIKGFMGVFCGALTLNEKITDENFDKFRGILDIAGTTANVTNAGVSSNGKTGKGIRYATKIEASFGPHSLDEEIEKSNKPSGWISCKLSHIELFGQRVEVKTFADIMQETLCYFYKSNPERLSEIKNNPAQYNLYALFFGTKGKGLVAPKFIIEGLLIEGKNGNNAKIGYLRKLFQAMGEDPKNLVIHAKLSKRIVD